MTGVARAGGLRAEVAALSDEAFAERIMAADRPATPPLTPPHPGTLDVARAVVGGRFTLIGETYERGEDASWSDNPSRDKEWLIAHHKFVWAPDLCHAYAATGDVTFARTWARLVDDWLRTMGTGFIAQSDAQVEAKRVEHWLASLAILRGTDWRAAVDGGLLRRMVVRLGEEAAYISEHLKPVRNHRTFQLLSVFLVGALHPELERAGDLAALGRELLTQNLLAEIHPDGVHLELSSHYHQLVCESAVAFAEAALATGTDLDPALLERIHRALEFSLWLQWPDGTIPLIGDSDVGDHRPLLARGAALFGDAHLRWGATLGAEGEPPQQRSRDFPSAGYAVLGDGWGADADGQAARTHLFYDAALLGEGSHSHYDVFSFTLYCSGAPAIVDPGRFTYSSDPDAQGVDWRHHFKSTAAHNTVAVDGRDQTRYLSRTKHGPEVEVRDRAVGLGRRSDWVRASAHSHEYAPVHERLLLFLDAELVVLVDRLDPTDDERHRYDLRLHLPETDLGRVAWRADGRGLAVQTAQCAVAAWLGDGAQAALDDGWVSRHYGVKHPAPVVRVTREGRGRAAFCTAIAPRRLRLDAVVAVGAPTGDPAALAFEVTGEDAGGPFAWTVLVAGPGSTPVRARDLTLHGPFAAVRRAAGGEITQVVGQRVERLDAGAAPLVGPQRPHDVEWDR